MSGFEAHLDGGYALTVSAARRWLGVVVLAGDANGEHTFEMVRVMLRGSGLVVEDHPKTTAAVVVSGGHCLPRGCTAEVFEALRPGGRGHHAGACERYPRLAERAADGVPRRG